MSMNKVILLGNLGRDPELKRTQSGVAVVSFSVACSEKWIDKQGQKQEKTEWINCSAWNKTAENIAKFFSKGSEILVEGKFTTRSWEDNGQKRYSSEVLVDSFQFTGGSTRGEKREQQEQHPNPEANDFYGFPNSGFGAQSNTSAPTLPVEEDLPF